MSGFVHLALDETFGPVKIFEADSTVSVAEASGTCTIPSGSVTLPMARTRCPRLTVNRALGTVPGTKMSSVPFVPICQTHPNIWETGSAIAFEPKNISMIGNAPAFLTKTTT